MLTSLRNIGISLCVQSANAKMSDDLCSLYVHFVCKGEAAAVIKNGGSLFYSSYTLALFMVGNKNHTIFYH